MQAIIMFLMKPIPIMPLIFFRVMFGGIMIWEVWRYFHYDRVARYFIEPGYFFHYFGFEWVKPLAGDAMNWLFVFLAVLAVLIAIGLFYRLAIILFCLIFSYIFLLDQTQYLNHFYLVSLISFLMIFMPAHRAWSLDALLRPSLESRFVPNWSLCLLRGQMAIVYVYGGIAKINPDWLRGEPMRHWLADRSDFPLIGHLFREEWMVYLFSYGGLLFDLFIVPFLLWHKTRIPALIVAIGFHLSNHQLFNIGIFPWFAMGITLLFLPPDWFRFRFGISPDTMQKIEAFQLTGLQKLGFAGLALYFGIQLLLPLRHFIYPGYVSWTEEGHTLAWHMKLRSKEGEARFFASHPASGTTWQIHLPDYLNERQINQMKDNPHMILRFSHYVGKQLAEELKSPVEIKVWSMMSLNGRAPQLLIDPTVDLTQQADSLSPADWILPLMQAPAPHSAYPTLLVSQLDSEVIILLNITETPFPMDKLSKALQFDTTMNWLEPHSCVFLYHDELRLQKLFPICNEVARHDTHIHFADIQASRIDPYDYHCRDKQCILVAQS